MSNSRRTWAVAVGCAGLVAAFSAPALAADGGRGEDRGGGHRGHSGHVRTVKMLDECDPATFNAALGPGACAPGSKGDVTFQELSAALTADPHEVWEEQDALGWEFTSTDLKVRVGDRIRAVNRGGEAHTFTEVDGFGPGCVPQLNAVFGLEGFDPACAELEAEIVPPGDHVTTQPLSRGKHYFECLIHPWMQTEVLAR